jgi:SAM-dependent MidA family methyltransferase
VPEPTDRPMGAEAEIRSRIADLGRITFREFMEVALYHPGGGYYTDPTARPNGGDYYTSPMAHPAFGAAIAVQLRAMWRALGEPSSFMVAEMGAGSGGLGIDVVAYADRLDAEFAGALQYVPLELGQPAPLGITGCVVSNELLDAMPVARFEVLDGEPKEVFVTVESDGTTLREVLGEPVTGLIQTRLASFPGSLPDGARGEVNPGASAWVESVGLTLSNGFVLTIDYGGTAQEIYGRRRGTLQTYYNHVDGLSPYQHIGRQDITAHVDFSLVEAEGTQRSLLPLGLVTQAELLRRSGIEKMANRLGTMGLSATELRANRYGLGKLTRPDGLGGFRVLVQEKGTGFTTLDGIWPSPGDLAELPEPPVLSAGHMRLAEGGYPSFSLELDSLWPESPESPDSTGSLEDSE